MAARTDPRRAAPEDRPEVALSAVRSGRVDLATIAAAARGCRACALWEHATQTVFGEGPEQAGIMVLTLLNRSGWNRTTKPRSMQGG